MITVSPLLPAVPVPHLSSARASIHGVFPVVSGKSEEARARRDLGGACEVSIHLQFERGVAAMTVHISTRVLPSQCFTLRPLLTTSFVIVWLG